jgi:2Fe-2S ferredoxin
MPTYKVTFLPANTVVTADSARYPCGSHGEAGSVLDIALAHGVEIEHACGGVGVCGTCHIIVRAGKLNLSPPSDDEMDVVDMAPGNTVDSRLACQAVVRGDVTVEIPGWNRNLASEGPA